MMNIYIIILCIIILLGIFIKTDNNKNKKIYIFIVFGLIMCVSAFRSYKVGIDTEQFVNAFKYINSVTVKKAMEVRYEVGFVFFCKMIWFLSENKQIYIIMTSIIIVPLVGLFIYKNSKDVVMSSMLFVTLNQFAMYMNSSRQAIAIALILIGYEFLKSKRYWLYILFIIIASLFHQTALIMLVLFLIKNIKYTNRSYIITILVGIICFFASDKIFNLGISLFNTYTSYKQSTFYESSILAGTLNAVVSLVILTFGIIICKNNRDAEYDFLAYIISILCIINILVIKINIFVRLATYFVIFCIIWIPKVLYMIKDNRKRIFIKYLIYICFFAYWLIISINRPEWYGVIPYSAFWRIQ